MEPVGNLLRRGYDDTRGGYYFTFTSQPHHHTVCWDPNSIVNHMGPVWDACRLPASFINTSQALLRPFTYWLRTSTWIGSRWEAFGANVKKPHTRHIHFPNSSQSVRIHFTVEWLGSLPLAPARHKHVLTSSSDYSQLFPNHATVHHSHITTGSPWAPDVKSL